MKLTPEESRVLRRETRGKGGLLRLGLMTVTAAGREWVRADAERIKQERIEGGAAGAKFGKRGGPKTWKKGGGK